MNIENKMVEALVSINQTLGVLSTVNSEDHPEAASMYYLCDDALNIYFVTRSASRKYKNLTANPHAAFVVTSEHPPTTLQLEGVASEVTDPNEQINYFSKLVAKASESTLMPPVSQMVQGEMVFMKISTTWVRFGDFQAMKEGDKFIEANIA